MKRILFNMAALALMSGALVSCTKDLDRLPANDITSEQVYSTPEGYKQALAKVYGSMALTGNAGPAGNGDIQGIDEGTSDFVRLYWWVQEVTTDEAVVQAGWNDPGIHFFHPMNWTTDNVIIKGVYYRSLYQITLCNEFMRQATDAKLQARGISGKDATDIRNFAQEARFLRAYQYSVLIDLFGNPPFLTENDAPGSVLPSQIGRDSLFYFIKRELADLETKLPAARTSEYGRVDRGAAQALMARLCLNHKVYLGSEVASLYKDAATYADKVITTGGYRLMDDYRQLMLADNNVNNPEFILTVNYDGLRTQGYGGTTFFTHASVGGDMLAANYGIGGGWAGIRTTKNLPNLFPDPNGTDDKRSQFFTAGQSIDLTADPAPNFREGYAVTKYRNVTRSGAPGQSLAFSDIDFPLFRLAEMYLVYAEAVLRESTAGDAGKALDYVNTVRRRAYGHPNVSGPGDIPSSSLTLDFILNERGRELYWECFRRSDLIRFDRFVEGTYTWPWKGGVSSGTAVPAFRKLFPIPVSDINSNTNLVQNAGY